MSATLSRGMTLIEMLVVLLIMGLLVSVTVLSTGMLSRGDNAASDTALAFAEDLSRLFEHASQQALAKNEVLGWSIVQARDSQSMHWWRWSSEAGLQTGTHSKPAWLPSPQSLTPVSDLPDGIRLQLNTDSRTMSAALTALNAQQINSPSVVFFPGREYSAFEIVVHDVDSGQTLARVWTERDGEIHWGAL